MTADPHPPDSYETVADVAQDEMKIQRSRFIGLVAPATDEAAARAFIQKTAATYHDARHVCYAWRLGYGRQIDEVRNDAGEPAGTAGEPILRALRQAELSDCVAVVVRYFGGIKLVPVAWRAPTGRPPVQPLTGRHAGPSGWAANSVWSSPTPSRRPSPAFWTLSADGSWTRPTPPTSPGRSGYPIPPGSASPRR